MVDLRLRLERGVPWVQILSFSCSFGKNLAMTLLSCRLKTDWGAGVGGGGEVALPEEQIDLESAKTEWSCSIYALIDCNFDTII